MALKGKGKFTSTQGEISALRGCTSIVSICAPHQSSRSCVVSSIAYTLVYILFLVSSIFFAKTIFLLLSYCFCFPVEPDRNLKTDGCVFLTCSGIIPSLFSSFLSAYPTTDDDVEKREATANSHVDDGPRKSTTNEEASAPRKEKSVLQAKLTKLAIQIGYGGVYHL